jgi:hypothetical protein
VVDVVEAGLVLMAAVAPAGVRSTDVERERCREITRSGRRENLSRVLLHRDLYRDL